MSALGAIGTRLLAVSGVTALTTRVHSEYAPRGTVRPYIVLHTLGGSPHHHAAAASPIGESTLQIDLHAASAVSRHNLAEAVRNALDGWAGTSATVAIDNIILDPPSNSIEGLNAGRESPTYKSRIDARVWFAQSAPTH